MNNNNIISKNQHGFVIKKSTITNLITTYEFVTKSLDEFYPVDIILLDFSKAFDKINIGKLISKIKLLSIPEYLTLWILNFLTNREQAVNIQNSLSSFLAITSGVPQGCVISPLLFPIYINVMYKIDIKSNIISFADDTKLYANCDKINMQIDLNNVQKWCSKTLCS